MKLRDQGIQQVIKIEHLSRHVNVIPTLALWVHEEWGHLIPELALADFISVFEVRTTPDRIPGTFVAVEGDKTHGMASLVEHDMSIRKDLSPWLAAVYVAPDSRNRGIGSRLVETVMQEAVALNVDKLYLFTPNKTGFYRRLGWRALEHLQYRGEDVVIMIYETSKQPTKKPANQPTS